eukprot:911848-Amphidinium_carterae.2
MSLALHELSVFEVPCTVAHQALGPTFDGQTPLRKALLPEFDDFLAQLLSDGNELLHASLRPDWSSCGDEIAYADLPLERRGDDDDDAPARQDEDRERDGAEHGDCFVLQLALLAVAEPPDPHCMEDDERAELLSRQRARGNAYVKIGQYCEATAAYNKALDVVRCTHLYKALFPTEHGCIDGAYSRDGSEKAVNMDQSGSGLATVSRDQ